MPVGRERGQAEVEGVLGLVCVGLIVFLCYKACGSAPSAPVLPVVPMVSNTGPIPSEAPADIYSSWKVYKGQIKTVQEMSESNKDVSENVWVAAIVGDDGSMMNAETMQIMVEGVKVCVALSPDRKKYLDQVIPCQ